MGFYLPVFTSSDTEMEERVSEMTDGKVSHRKRVEKLIQTLQEQSEERKIEVGVFQHSPRKSVDADK